MSGPTAPGWPFAVGAGRLLDYRVVAAPDVLVQAGVHGALGDVVTPGRAGGPATRASLDTAVGRFTVVHATHALTLAELAPPGGPAPGGPAPGGLAGAARDAAGRPLLLVYGLVVPRDGDAVVEDCDLDRARDVALRAYRAFREDERPDAVVATAPLPLPTLPAGSAAVTAASSPGLPPPAPARQDRARADRARPSHALRRVAALALAVLVVAAGAVVVRRLTAGEPAVEAAIARFEAEHPGTAATVGDRVVLPGCALVEVNGTVAVLVDQGQGWQWRRWIARTAVAPGEVRTAEQCLPLADGHP